MSTRAAPPGREAAAKVLEALPREARPLVEAVLRAADRRGDRVYLVGGPVRDFLLGRPIADVDLIVEDGQGGGAADLAREAAPPGARVISHGRFGTVRIELDAGAVDLATVRSETYAHPGALPTVGPGDLCADLRRRDFTVNAIAIPLSEAARRVHPGIVACRGALEDLERGILRVFHPRSFHDDPTRAFRAARFAARLGFRLSRETRGALRDALRDGAFGFVSGDRIRRELEKLFDESTPELPPTRALRLLDSWHVLGALEPGLDLPRQALAPLRRLARALAERPWPLGSVRCPVVGLIVWLAYVTATVRRRTLERLAVRGELAGRIAGFPAERRQVLRALGRTRGRGAIDALLGRLDGETLLALFVTADAVSRRKIARYAALDRPRRPPVTGRDLLGVGLSGPAVGRALARIRAAYLDGTIRGREEALALARELARRGGRRPGRADLV